MLGSMKSSVVCQRRLLKSEIMQNTIAGGKEKAESGMPNLSMNFRNEDWREEQKFYYYTTRGFQKKIREGENLITPLFKPMFFFSFFSPKRKLGGKEK